ncbi:uncharacterized protein LOC119556273 [Drosophila subpulchrella]|uniref:uncharacterized protein LOC119556273 n=1 Tax=Drosophila subpulchrella TaxID=1486046 RepID=UPI0018A14E93|nr:uncharacterized protein LOC119556273 [Drosophila subpulchrella]
MRLPIVTLLLLFLVTAFAAGPVLAQAAGVDDYADFEDNSDTDRMASTTSKGSPISSPSTVLKTISSTSSDSSTTSTSPATTQTSTTTQIAKDSTHTTVSTNAVPTTTVSTTADPTTTVPTTTAEQLTEEEIILALLAENSAAQTVSNTLLNTVSTFIWNIDEELDSHSESLDLVEDTKKLLQNKTQELLFWKAKFLRGVVTSIQKIDLFANRTIDTASQLLSLQKENLDRVKDLGVKLNITEGQILRTSKRLDNKLNFVRELLLYTVEPKVNSLKESFAILNTSQVNSLAELENVPLVRNLTETSIIKLSSLNKEVVVINQTQENSFDSLKDAIKARAPTNLSTASDLFQVISISQKRTDLAFALCGSSEYSRKATHFENYNAQYIRRPYLQKDKYLIIEKSRVVRERSHTN